MYKCEQTNFLEENLCALQIFLFALISRPVRDRAHWSIFLLIYGSICLGHVITGKPNSWQEFKNFDAEEDGTNMFCHSFSSIKSLQFVKTLSHIQQPLIPIVLHLSFHPLSHPFIQ